MPERRRHTSTAWFGLVLTAAILFGRGAAFGQGGAAADENVPDADLQTTEQTVKVEGSANDQAIAQRLSRILQASDRYAGLSVDVRDGIVFLEGQTEQDDYKAWATDLARRTQDVVAVVNNLRVTPPPVFEESALRAEERASWRGFLRALPLIGVGLVLLLIAAGMAWAAARLIRRPLGLLAGSQLLQNVFRKLLVMLILLGGVVAFLRVSGLTGIAVTVVSGTGLLGLIVGFAFKDIAENFLASILLSVQTPFRLGDVIEVAGYTGVVQKVTPRGTVLVDFDGNHIQIANATVYKSTIKNLTANPKMRLNFTLGIGYDAGIKPTQELIFEVLQEQEAVLTDPPPMVLVDELGSATINLKVFFWIDGHLHSGLKTRSAVMRRVLRAVEQAGVSLPDEAREIIFPQGIPVGVPEGFAKPTLAAPSESAKRAASSEDLQDQATAAEGGLSSEVGEIRKQASEARDPEEGPAIVD